MRWKEFPIYTDFKTGIDKAIDRFRHGIDPFIKRMRGYSDRLRLITGHARI